MTPAHICDEYCLCPEHDTVMLYNKRLESHACQDRQCKYAHGYESEMARPDPGVNYEEVRDWLETADRKFEQRRSLWFEEYREEEPDGVARGQSGSQGRDPRPQGCH